MKNMTEAKETSLLSQLGVTFYLIFSFTIFLVILIQIPASVPAKIMTQQTNCRLIPHLIEGSIWKGSSAIGFSTQDPKTGDCHAPHFVTERFHWDTQCHWLRGLCEVTVHSRALKNPVVIHMNFQGAQVAAGSVNIPGHIVEIWGGTFASLKPRATIFMDWSNLVLSYASDKNTTGLVKLKVFHLNTLVSPIKDLGSYEMTLMLSDKQSPWTLATVNGPLILTGTGSWDSKGLHFSGQASSAQGFQDSLKGLLHIMGQKNGDFYKVQF